MVDAGAAKPSSISGGGHESPRSSQREGGALSRAAVRGSSRRAQRLTATGPGRVSGVQGGDAVASGRCPRGGCRRGGGWGRVVEAAPGTSEGDGRVEPHGSGDPLSLGEQHGFAEDGELDAAAGEPSIGAVVVCVDVDEDSSTVRRPARGLRDEAAFDVHGLRQSTPRDMVPGDDRRRCCASAPMTPTPPSSATAARPSRRPARAAATDTASAGAGGEQGEWGGGEPPGERDSERQRAGERKQRRGGPGHLFARDNELADRGEATSGPWRARSGGRRGTRSGRGAPARPGCARPALADTGRRDRLSSRLARLMSRDRAAAAGGTGPARRSHGDGPIEAAAGGAALGAAGGQLSRAGAGMSSAAGCSRSGGGELGHVRGASAPLRARRSPPRRVRARTSKSLSWGREYGMTRVACRASTPLSRVDGPIHLLPMDTVSSLTRKSLAGDAGLEPATIPTRA